jgi:RpiB/LacA/LacB family sugar-phosphate isomerase/HAD superfamily hydrolase (TIGR01509 family)
MRIVIGTDHAGFPLKKDTIARICELGHQVVDIGTHSTEPVDYPLYVEALGNTLLHGRAERGVLICGSGVGASVAANKMPGIRAGLCHDTYSAHQGVEHDNMNVLVLGGRVIGRDLARELVTVYLQATFSGEERHRRRLQKVDALEGRYGLYSRSLQKQVRRTEPITADRYEAVLLDMDGVVTDTAGVHAACWKTMFDEHLQKWARQNARPFRAFDLNTDYKIHVDGKPRVQGVLDFLRSRGITMPDGRPDDPPTAETTYGLGNRKSELVINHLASAGVDAYPGSVAFLKYLRASGIKTAVVTSSQISQSILHAARIDHLFDARVDGNVLLHQGLIGKPSPDSLLKAAQILRVAPERTVVVDDSISGIRAGAQGGFGLVIGVNRKGNADELKANGADIVVNDLAELINYRTSEVA